MNELILNEAEFERMVVADKGQVVTTSLRVAEYFGKTHKAVLRKISSKKCSSSFTERNFALSSYVDSSGRTLPMWEMTKSGFMFVAMGFTGEKADLMKERFIDAFDWMAEQLLKRTIDFNAVRNELVLEYRHWKSVTSLAGRTMRSWQLRKPGLEGDMQALGHEGQYQLFHA